MCDISDDVKNELKKFRFAKNNESSALICKENKGFVNFILFVTYCSLNLQ